MGGRRFESKQQAAQDRDKMATSRIVYFGAMSHQSKYVSRYIGDKNVVIFCKNYRHFIDLVLKIPNEKEHKNCKVITLQELCLKLHEKTA